jgi:hypothetical protein
MTTEFKLYKSPRKALLVSAYTLPFVIIGLCFILSDEFGTSHKMIGWFSVFFFGLGESPEREHQFIKFLAKSATKP